MTRSASCVYESLTFVSNKLIFETVSKSRAEKRVTPAAKKFNFISLLYVLYEFHQTNISDNKHIIYLKFFSIEIAFPFAVHKHFDGSIRSYEKSCIAGARTSAYQEYKTVREVMWKFKWSNSKRKTNSPVTYIPIYAELHAYRSDFTIYLYLLFSSFQLTSFDTKQVSFRV